MHVFLKKSICKEFFVLITKRKLHLITKTGMICSYHYSQKYTNLISCGDIIQYPLLFFIKSTIKLRVRWQEFLRWVFEHTALHLFWKTILLTRQFTLTFTWQCQRISQEWGHLTFFDFHIDNMWFRNILSVLAPGTVFYNFFHSGFPFCVICQLYTWVQCFNSKIEKKI